MRTVGIFATPDGQRYAAIIEDEAHGLSRTEIVTGFSYFPCGSGRTRSTPGSAWGCASGS